MRRTCISASQRGPYERQEPNIRRTNLNICLSGHARDVRVGTDSAKGRGPREDAATGRRVSRDETPTMTYQAPPSSRIAADIESGSKKFNKDVEGEQAAGGE